MSEELLPSDRRRDDRRAEFVPLAEWTLPELRKALITTALLLIVIGLFLYMVRDVLVAAVAGVVLGAYLIPLFRWVLGRVQKSTLAAILTILMVTVPIVSLMAYSWRELAGAAEYLNSNRDEVAARLTVGLQKMPFMEEASVENTVNRLMETVNRESAEIVTEIQEAGSIIMIAVSVLLFTAFYILTDHKRLLEYIRSRIPGRYRELTDEVGGSIRAVIYGALYGTFVTQFLKSAIVLIMNLLWGVPLAAVLAMVAFFVGFFPIVGSYLVYTPVALYLLLWRGDIVGGIVFFLVGLLGNTIFITMYLRPKLAAARSHVLNFYWMFIALLTGVYTFGLVGIIIGPVLIAVLRAIFETISGPPREVAPVVDDQDHAIQPAAD
jgi:predicted PurR-regulated permease PerM